MPLADTVATAASSEVADTVCASPESPSVIVTVLVPELPRDTVRSEMAPTAGRLFGTVTVNVAAAEVAFGAPLSSVAVTEIVAVPRDTPRTVSVLPETETVATDVSSERAETVCASPLSASVTVTVRLPVVPRDTAISAMAPTAGRLFRA